MAENKIQYTKRTYDEVLESVKNIAKNYYPDVFANIDDASIGAFLMEVIADCTDNLHFHLDRVYQETNIDTATQFSSLLNIARTNGLKLNGRKCAICEVEFSCVIPTNGQSDMMADEDYCPVIKRGTTVSDGSVSFETIADIDFSKQFNSEGISDRKILPIRNSNGAITGYKYSKLAVVRACRSKIYKKVITEQDIRPFMEITLPDNDVVSVDSIIMKQGTNLVEDPQMSEFLVDEETYIGKDLSPVQRFFEVDNLADQKRFGYEVEQTTPPFDITNADEYNQFSTNYYNPVWEKVIVEAKEICDENGNGMSVYDADGNMLPSFGIVERLVMKGLWKRLKNKFITEYTDDWHLKITFGAGIRNQYGNIPENASDYTRYMMSRMLANDYMGVLPEANTTLFILYSVGGGEMTNIAKDTLTNITYLNMSIDGNCNDAENNSKVTNVRNTLRVTNTTPSYGGKDEPSETEIKYWIKYNNGEQNRCVTINDYISRLYKLPPKFGMPFRHNVTEENNKVCIYTLGLDSEGHLTNAIPEPVAKNIQNYLKNYRCINDYVEIRSGKIVNLAVELTVFIDKTYEKGEVVKRIIDMVNDYFDIRRHMMGEDIFVGDVEKNITGMDGVVQVSDFRVFNIVGNAQNSDYSYDEITQTKIDPTDCCHSESHGEGEYDNGNEIDLDKSDYILFGEPDTMFEIKYKEKNIKVIAKVR